jgi:rubrerythrin
MTIQMTGADVIDLAVQTETRGEQFYRHAAREADAPEARQLFAFLAEEETRHRAIFSGLSAGVVASEIDPQTWAEAVMYIEATVDRAFFSGAGAPLREIPAGAREADLLRQAIDFEKETLLFFVSLRDLVQPASQRLIDDIVREERGHVASLARRLAALPAEEREG